MMHSYSDEMREELSDHQKQPHSHEKTLLSETNKKSTDLLPENVEKLRKKIALTNSVEFVSNANTKNECNGFFNKEPGASLDVHSRYD